jgi:hypothetical protein
MKNFTWKNIRLNLSNNLIGKTNDNEDERWREREEQTLSWNINNWLSVAVDSSVVKGEDRLHRRWIWCRSSRVSAREMPSKLDQKSGEGCETLRRVWIAEWERGGGEGFELWYVCLYSG